MHPIAALMLSETIEADHRREATRRRWVLDLFQRPEARPTSGPTRRAAGHVGGIARLDFDRV